MLTSKDTRETLDLIRAQIALSLLEGSGDDVVRMLNALLQAYKDHVVSLEAELASTRQYCKTG